MLKASLRRCRDADGRTDDEATEDFWRTWRARVRAPAADNALRVIDIDDNEPVEVVQTHTELRIIVKVRVALALRSR